MNVLVIGATGYLGSVVAEHLATAGHRVIALTRAAVTAPGLRREAGGGGHRTGGP